jgi:S1-C subfamily serine protease
VNRAGHVIGINTALIPSAHGIGFAIPTSTASPVLRALIESGAVVRPGLGLVARSVTPQVAFANDLTVDRGVLVLEVEAGGPAEQAGLWKGDVIMTVAGQPVRDLHEFHAAIWRRKPGEAVEVSVRREGETLRVRVALRAEPSSPARR